MIDWPLAVAFGLLALSTIALAVLLLGSAARARRDLIDAIKSRGHGVYTISSGSDHVTYTKRIPPKKD